MVKLDLLRFLANSVRPRDTYSEAEVKMRTFLNQLRESGTIQDFDVRSDPAGTEYTVYWTFPGRAGFEKFRVDPKRIDVQMLTVMEVLES